MANNKTVITAIGFFIIGGLIGFGAGQSGILQRLGSGEEQGEQMEQQAGMDEATDFSDNKTSDGSSATYDDKAGTPAPIGTDAADVPNEPSGQASMSGENNTLMINDQTPGNKVVITNVALEKTSWVVIHDEKAGKPGNILGAQRFPAGVRTGAVDLLRETVADKTYYAMLHTDSGGPQFNAINDMPLKNQNGMPIMVTFRTTASAQAQ
ncbi:MAG: hypothetical protein HY006_01540 [Candidatus Sungbacteria bacterium]|nr:hypothetical protein [Candidatus Sungbacteria bacterium]